MILCGDSREALKGLPDSCVSSVVTDPPYELGFMGKAWDSTGVAYDVELWRQALRVLKPGGHLLAFGGARTYHRLAYAVEDAGFEIRDQIMWIYGQGFSKGRNISKAIDKAAGAERAVLGMQHRKNDRDATSIKLGRVSDDFPITAPATDAARQWDGWNTSLKPSHEPIVLARKPFSSTVEANVQEFGTGALNVDACRVAGPKPDTTRGAGGQHGITSPRGAQGRILDDGCGRWPANVVHNGSDEAVAGFPESSTHGALKPTHTGLSTRSIYGQHVKGGYIAESQVNDSGSAARFFYCAKPSKAERQALNDHATVKPVTLMRWLVRLVTPPNGLVLDPFLGSGTTGIACEIEGFPWIGIEQDPSTAAMAQARIARDDGAVAESKMNGSAPPTQIRPIEGPLFEGMG